MVRRATLAVGTRPRVQDRVVAELDAIGDTGRVEHEDIAIVLAVERELGDRQVADAYTVAIWPQRCGIVERIGV